MPLVAAVLAVAPLGGADPARAQSSADPIWSATLTLANVGGSFQIFLGYESGVDGSLAPNTFSHGGGSFTVSRLDYSPSSDELGITFSWTGSPTFVSAYALCFDGALAFTGSGTEMFGTSGTLNDLAEIGTVKSDSPLGGGFGVHRVFGNGHGFVIPGGVASEQRSLEDKTIEVLSSWTWGSA